MIQIRGSKKGWALLIPVLFNPLIVSAVSVGSSVISNGGFESGLTSWNVDKSNTSINTATPLIGTRSLRIGAGTNGGRAQILSVALEPGAKYRVSGYGRMAAASDVATIGAEFYNTAGTRVLNQWIQVKGTATKLYTFDVQIPFGADSVHLYTFKNVGTQAVDFDNLDLVKIADP